MQHALHLGLLNASANTFELANAFEQASPLNKLQPLNKPQPLKRPAAVAESGPWRVNCGFLGDLLVIL